MCPKVNKIQLKSSGTWPGIRKSGAACLGLLIEELSCSHANVGQPEALQGKVKRGMELLKRIVAEWQCNCNYFADQFPTLSLGGVEQRDGGRHRDLEPRDPNKGKAFPLSPKDQSRPMKFGTRSLRIVIETHYRQMAAVEFGSVSLFLALMGVGHRSPPAPPVGTQRAQAT